MSKLGDFHIHSTGSDGLFNLDLILAHYRDKGYSHIAITDHYVISDCIKNDDILDIKKRQYGIDIIVGSEQVAEINGEFVHLLCYFNSNKDVTEPIQELMVGQENFVRAFNERIKRVMKERGVYIPDIDYTQLDARSYMPILMEVVKRTGKTPKETRGEFFGLMGGLDFEGKTRLDAKELIEEVHKSKGLIVVAHPYQFKRETVEMAIELGVDGLEVYYPTHTEKQVQELKELAKKNNLLVTAGSDFHHPLDTVKHGNIGSVALKGAELKAFLGKLKGWKEIGKLQDTVKGFLESMGVILEKNTCGEHYFATYNNKTTLINLVDLSLNSTMFGLNSSKRQSMSILKKYDVPHIEVIDLSLDRDEAIEQSIKYFKDNGKFLIRGDKGTCGNNTFFIEIKDDIYHALKMIDKTNVRPFISPYYEAMYEYRAMYLNGKVEFAVKKEINPLTGKHNLSTGSLASVVNDESLMKQIEEISCKVASIFDLKFAAIDIMDTKDGLKVVEFGIPNINRFASMNSYNYSLCEKLFQKAFIVKQN